MAERFITTWRKPDSILDWDHYVSEDRLEAERVAHNLKSRGVSQFHTFRLGDSVAELCSLVPPHE